VKNFKETSYIQLLWKKEKISATELEIAFYDFTQEVYQFCMKEQNLNLKYFSLQYVRAFLITFPKSNEEKTPILHIKGAISFVEAAIEWVMKQKRETPQLGNEESTDKIPPPIVWTGKVIHLMEFIYGSDTLKNFNDGKVTIKEVSAYFGKMLGIEIKDPSGCYVSMRERAQESRTTYIDSMRDALLERMEKDDEKLYRRKK